VTAKERAKLELQRSRAQAAAQCLAEIEVGGQALADLRRLVTNPRGFSSLDSAYREKFMVVFNALNAGLRDGIFPS
jgi:hypothetical protein